VTVDDEEQRDVTSNSVNISGGKFTGATAMSAGNNNTVTGSMNAGPPPTRGDLSATLRDVHDQLVAAGSTPEEQQEIADSLRKILVEVDSDTPVPARVRSRWSVVESIVGAAATTGTAIAETTGKISEMITAVFGA
jgi:hypothetical protein